MGKEEQKLFERNVMEKTKDNLKLLRIYTRSRLSIRAQLMRLKHLEGRIVTTGGNM